MALQGKTNNNGDDHEEGELTQRRRKREYEFSGDGAKSCVSCHNACMQLFGLGASAKVCLLGYLISYSQPCMVVLSILN